MEQRQKNALRKAGSFVLKAIAKAVIQAIVRMLFG
jgi:hypothetical protein